jgi:3-dehydroquinate synthase class II
MRRCLPAPVLQVLVEAELPDGDLCSVLLQNAETVRLVGPSSSTESDSSSRSGSRSKSSGSGSRLPEAQQSDPATDGYVWQEGSTSGSRGHDAGWRAVPVSELKAGDEVLVLRQGGARHTGVAIEESIVER